MKLRLFICCCLINLSNSSAQSIVLRKSRVKNAKRTTETFSTLFKKAKTTADLRNDLCFVVFAFLLDLISASLLCLSHSCSWWPIRPLTVHYILCRLIQINHANSSKDSKQDELHDRHFFIFLNFVQLFFAFSLSLFSWSQSNMQIN